MPKPFFDTGRYLLNIYISPAVYTLKSLYEPFLKEMDG